MSFAHESTEDADQHTRELRSKTVVSRASIVDSLTTPSISSARFYSTQADACAHRETRHANHGFIVGRDVHTDKEGHVMDPARAKENKAAKEYAVVNMDTFNAMNRNATHAYRNYYHLADLSDPVNVYMDMDLDLSLGDIGPIKSLAQYLSIEQQEIIDPVERYLSVALGVDRSCIRGYVMDSSVEGMKVSRHYVWKSPVMFRNNLHLGEFMKSFEVYLMTRPGGKLPHDPTNVWYFKGKRPYPSFIFDYIYTTRRLFRSLGSCKFGSERVLKLTAPGACAPPGDVHVTSIDMFDTCIFYPHHYPDSSNADTVQIVEWKCIPAEVVMGAPKLINHWPLRAFNGTEKNSSDQWYRHAVLLTGVSRLEWDAARVSEVDNAVNAKLAVTNHTKSSELGFLIPFVEHMIPPGTAKFTLGGHKFDTLRMTVELTSNNRYCPARDAEEGEEKQYIGVRCHKNNTTSIIISLESLAIRWHCYGTGHSATISDEYLHKYIRPNYLTAFGWQAQATAFVRRYKTAPENTTDLRDLLAHAAKLSVNE